MPTRIYYPALTQETERIELPPKQAQHIRVLRLHLGETLHLFNGRGHFASATLIHLDKKFVHLERDALQIAEPPTTYPIHLVQAMTRNDTMDWIIQKATELGVKSITPIMSERTQGRLKADQLEKKISHWQEIIISAAEQSHLNFLPILKIPLTLAEYLKEQDQHSPPLLIFDPESPHSFHDLRSHPKTCQILIGPEGGFTAAEIKTALTHQATSLRLHQNILRAETAAITALSICQFHFGLN